MTHETAKTRHAPPRHSRDARVYGHTTTAMHELSYPPPSPPPYRRNQWLFVLNPVSLSESAKANVGEGGVNFTTGLSTLAPVTLHLTSDSVCSFKTTITHEMSTLCSFHHGSPASN